VAVEQATQENQLTPRLADVLAATCYHQAWATLLPQWCSTRLDAYWSVDRSMH
jgi:hypothetical protein